MIDERIQDAINEQIKVELESAYVYLAAAAYCEAIDFPGAARWMRAQSKEEASHAMRLFEYLIDRNGRVALQALPKPPFEFPSLQGVFESALEHERRVTAAIQRLYDLAAAAKDHATEVALHWFVTEQVEEEKTTEEIVARLRLIGNDGTGLHLLDRELGERNE
ncbi:MAG TPA: ferritin [Limnochordia bacterium]